MPIRVESAGHVVTGSSSHCLGIVLVLEAKPFSKSSARKVRYIPRGIDIGIARTKRLIDEDTVSHCQSRGLCQVCVRLDPNSRDNDIDCESAVSIGSNHELVRLSVDALHSFAEANIDAMLAKIDVEEIRERSGVEAVADASAWKDQRHFPSVH